MMNDVESKAIQNKYIDEEDEAFCTKVNCFAAITIPSFFGKYAQSDKPRNFNLLPCFINEIYCIRSLTKQFIYFSPIFTLHDYHVLHPSR